MALAGAHRWLVTITSSLMAASLMAARTNMDTSVSMNKHGYVSMNNSAILKSLNIGSARSLQVAGRNIQTAIFKTAVTESLELGVLGFASDVQVNKKYHGGPDKAVCAYANEHYDHWRAVLGQDLPQAAFGENFTLTGLLEDQVRIGDTFRIGTARIQVSQPRQPCGTLAARYGRKDFVKQVSDSGMTGWYFRVLEAGMVQAGDHLELIEAGEITVTAANQVMYAKVKPEKIQHLLAQAALSQAWRQQLEQRL
jgi:MOSC domain-containing protein YiiM